MNDVRNEVHVDHSIGEISPTLWVLFDFPFDLTILNFTKNMRKNLIIILQSHISN